MSIMPITVNDEILSIRNNQTPNDVPDFSDATKEIFKELKCPIADFPVKSKVRTLEATIQRYNDAKQNSTKNKLKAFLELL